MRDRAWPSVIGSRLSSCSASRSTGSSSSRRCGRGSTSCHWTFKAMSHWASCSEWRGRHSWSRRSRTGGTTCVIWSLDRFAGASAPAGTCWPCSPFQQRCWQPRPRCSGGQPRRPLQTGGSCSRTHRRRWSCSSCSSTLPEEIGWTGFLQARLQDHHGPLKASVLTASPFAFFHMPVNVVEEGWVFAWRSCHPDDAVHVRGGRSSSGSTTAPERAR